MTVRLTLVDGSIQLFNSDNFCVSPIENTRAEIIKVEVYSMNKKIISKKRRFAAYYKKFIYPAAKARQDLNDRVNKEDADTTIEQ